VLLYQKLYKRQKEQKDLLNCLDRKVFQMQMLAMPRRGRAKPLTGSW